MSLPGSPHDKLFKAAFSDPTEAAALLRAVLNADARSKLKLGSLTPLPTEFVDAVLAGSECDLLFGCELDGKPGLALTLFEHKSHSDKWVLLQLLRYELRAWEHCIATRDEALLPPIVAVIVHHGPERFRGPRQFAKLFARTPKALGRFVPHFEVVVDDLSALDDAALDARGFGDFAHATAALLRDGRVKGQSLTTLQSLRERLRRLYRQAGGTRAVSMLLEYLFRVTDAEPHAVEAAAQDVLPDARGCPKFRLVARAKICRAKRAPEERAAEH